MYLMAQVGFGVYCKKTNKMVLLGASHRYSDPLEETDGEEGDGREGDGG